MRSLFITLLFLTLTVVTASSGELDTYYLQQFGESPTVNTSTLKKSIPVYSAHKCGMPLRHNLKLDWKKLEPSTQQTLAKYLAKPTLTNPATLTSSSGHFIIHYEPVGANTPIPGYPYNVTSWVQKVADTFEEVYTKEVINMGYTPPNVPYDVYLTQQPKDNFGNVTFGITQSIDINPQNHSATSFIEIDNDFIERIYQVTIPGNGTVTEKAINALQITAAHEFHHAIQYSYNFYFEIWYAEATSSWMEDEVYDNVNQLYNYLGTYLSNTDVSLYNSAGYDRWIFNRFTAEQFNDAGTIKSIWNQIKSTSPIGGADIPTMPLLDNYFKSNYSSIDAELISFAKRLYKNDWTTHTIDIPLITQYPLNIHGIFSSYPVTKYDLNTLVTLPAYSFAYYRFTPSPSAPEPLQITINKHTQITPILLVKTGTTYSEIPFINSAFTISNFHSSNEAMLIIVNGTGYGNTKAAFSTDGNPSSDLQTPTPPTPPPSSSTGGGGGGCFIATAAFGSYMHPEVMVLRQFRDNYLLTNAPGRAFVAAYYSVSPTIADYIRDHDNVRAFVRLLLAPLIIAVKNLKLTCVMAATLAMAATALLLRPKARFLFRKRDN